MSHCPLNIFECVPSRNNRCPAQESDCRLNRDKSFPRPAYIESRDSFKNDYLSPLISSVNDIALENILHQVQEDISTMN